MNGQHLHTKMASILLQGEPRGGGLRTVRLNPHEQCTTVVVAKVMLGRRVAEDMINIR